MTYIPLDSVKDETDKIDSAAADGLLGVAGSASYRIHEIEKHLHSREEWFGVHSSVSAGVNEGEAWSVTPFDSTSGADGVFGSWIPLLGSGDTPFQATYAKFDPHRLIISNVDAGANKLPHQIQIAWGASGAAGFGAGDYTGTVATPERDGKASPIVIQCPRITAGTLMFLRHAVIGAATQGMDFYFGIHEYAG